jgi:hypothetical protein
MGIRLKISKGSKIASIGLVSSRNCRSSIVALLSAGSIESLATSSVPFPCASCLTHLESFLDSRLHASFAFTLSSYSPVWLAYCMLRTHADSRELRMELRVSETRIRDFEYPAFFPSPPQSLSSQGETAWYYYLAEIALQRLKSRILYHTYYQYSGAPSSINTDLILNFEHQAKEW